MHEQALDIVKETILSDIHRVMEGRMEVVLEDLYLGKYSPALSGYPEIEAIKRDDNGSLYLKSNEPYNEENDLDDYTERELVALLDAIEFKLKEE